MHKACGMHCIQFSRNSWIHSGFIISMFLIFNIALLPLWKVEFYFILHAMPIMLAIHSREG